MPATAKLKEIRCNMTPGVDALDLPLPLLTSLFETAIIRYAESKGQKYMTTYIPNGININIGDGNEQIKTDINCFGLKEPLSCMIDDYNDFFVATLLTPSEY